jgi:uncharacterized protein YlxP (DUF503 family)
MMIASKIASLESECRLLELRIRQSSTNAERIYWIKQLNAKRSLTRRLQQRIQST